RHPSHLVHHCQCLFVSLVRTGKHGITRSVCYHHVVHKRAPPVCVGFPRPPLRAVSTRSHPVSSGGSIFNQFPRRPLRHVPNQQVFDLRPIRSVRQSECGDELKHVSVTVLLCVLDQRLPNLVGEPTIEFRCLAVVRQPMPTSISAMLRQVA